ncbi:ABC transporter permease [Emticicia sp. TH156]|uniref:ABC transporter permease n=1 Tax=Emticicia sp. TH156 TaxID=2067454 RepID=UPI000C76A32F|nr:ABC transporter permease [Emticicia sp. TH156]PLK45185.1 ABC transporter permease [Emticicia sp. TH156]
MKNIFLVLKREYLTRVRKKSFIVMTILGPLLIAAFYGIIGWTAMSSISLKKIEVIDQSNLFKEKFKNSEELNYTFSAEALENAKKSFSKSGYDALVFIPNDIMTNPKGVKIFSEKSLSIELQRGIEKNIEREIETIKLTEAGITQKVLEDAKMSVSSETISLSAEGEKSNSSVAATVIGYVCAFLIYITVFIFGVQVMRSVMEEKTSRIVEVIISSIKPFELMMGKIIGVALVGLTQFALWILLTFAITTAVTSLFGKKFSASPEQRLEQVKKMPQAQEIEKQVVKETNGGSPYVKIMKAIQTLPWVTILVCFIFYFLGGYLMYSALFGAIGSAVDSETDVQQFMFPITMPIIFSIAIAQFVIREPDGALAFWTSMIPFTSPIIMMVRIPFGVPTWQIILSMVILSAGFIGTTWLAGRIYRVGILMFGKKPTFKEIGKWIFYKG